MFEATSARPGDKRQRESLGDPSDIEGYKGVLLTFIYKSTLYRQSDRQRG